MPTLSGKKPPAANPKATIITPPGRPPRPGRRLFRRLHVIPPAHEASTYDNAATSYGRKKAARRSVYQAAMDRASSFRNGYGVATGVCAADSRLRDQVAEVLTRGGHPVVGIGADPTEFIDACGDTSLGCVVVTAQQVDAHAVGAIREICGVVDSDSSVLICERAGTGPIRRALGAGVTGIVLTHEVDAALGAVVDAVSAGQVCVPREQGGSVRAAILTTREKQILSLVVMGLTNAQIASRLYLAESTVKSHLSSAFSKLDVSSRNEAVSVILDPDRGRRLGILAMPAEQVSSGINGR